jgi:hypothetical protein
MGLVALFDDQEREYKRLYKDFSLEFARLRGMVEDIEADRKFVRENGRSDELPSTESVAEVREKILENSTYLLVSKGDLKDQIKKVQKLPDKVLSRLDKGENNYLKDLRDFNVDACNRYKDMARYWEDPYSLIPYLEELETPSQPDNPALSSYRALAREHAKLGVKIPRYKSWSTEDGHRGQVGAVAHCLAQAVCIPLQKEIDLLQTIFEDDISHLRTMLENVSEAIASIIGVREEYNLLRRGLDEDLDYQEDIDYIDQTDEKRSLLLNSIHGIKS